MMMTSFASMSSKTELRYTGEYDKDQQQHVFDIFCLKLKFSSNVTPRVNTMAAGVILIQNMCCEKAIKFSMLRWGTNNEKFGLICNKL